MTALVPQAVIDAARSIAEDYIKGIEQLRLKAYQNPGDVPTIGFGHVRGVHLGMTITAEQAEDFLTDELDQRIPEIIATLKRTPTAHQLGALISFQYNIGEAAFAGSTVLRKFNAGDIQAAAAAFGRWIKTGDGTGKKVDSDGLKRRRREEVQIFLTPDTNPTPTFIPTEDAPHAEPDQPAPMPQTVEATGGASTVEKIVTVIAGSGGVTGGLSLAEKAAEKGPATLAILLLFVLLVAAGVGAWWFFRARRKG